MDSSAFPVLVPLLNPNEPESKVVALEIHNGQRVSAGDLICTLETTKSAADLTAEHEGYIVGLTIQLGYFVTAGEVFCYLATSPEWKPPEAITTPASSSMQPVKASSKADLPPGLRITQPALTLARQANLELSVLPVGPLVTETMLRSILEKAQPISLPDIVFNADDLIVYGGGGHGKSLVELIRSRGDYQIVGIVDDGLSPSDTILGLPVFGGGDILPALHAKGLHLAVNAVGGIGNLTSRITVFKKLLQSGFDCPVVIHPSTVVEPSSTISNGVQIFSHAYIGSEACLGFGVIVNTSAVISHDCVLGDYVNISPGALLAGGVQVATGVLVGMGVTINLGVKVGAGARLGNGSNIKADVPENGIIRAGTTWPT